MGFEAEDTIFKSEEFKDFNEFTANMSAVKIFEYANEIKNSCSEDQYSAAWGYALKGARIGLDNWEEDGALGDIDNYMDDGIITELYDFFFICNGGA
jgi:hypothetical protein